MGFPSWKRAGFPWHATRKRRKDKASEVSKAVKDQHALYEKLQELKEGKLYIMSISENKKSLRAVLGILRRLGRDVV